MLERTWRVWFSCFCTGTSHLDDLTARCVFGCLDELESGELSSLFLLLLAMLTMVVLDTESYLVRDTQPLLVVLVRLMLLLGSLDLLQIQMYVNAS